MIQFQNRKVYCPLYEFFDQSNLSLFLLFSLIALTLNLSAQTETKTVTSTQLNWHTDLMKASEISAATHKPIFAFTLNLWTNKIQMIGKSPIGVFDSGYGGLTILSDIQKRLPQYDFLYFS